MNESSEKLPVEQLQEKLEPFAEEFRNDVLSYQTQATPELLERIVNGLLSYHTGEDFAHLKAQHGDAVRLVEDLELDSLALIEISFHAEEFVGLVIHIEDFADIKTLGDLLGYLKERIFPHPPTS